MDPLLENSGSHKSFSTSVGSKSIISIGSSRWTLKALAAAREKVVGLAMLYVASCVPILWITLSKPQWYRELLTALGWPEWFLPIIFGSFCLISGPVKVLSNLRLSSFKGYEDFLETLEEELGDDERFRKEFPTFVGDKVLQSPSMRWMLWRLFCYGVVPSIVGFLAGVPHWELAVVGVSIPENARASVCWLFADAHDVAIKASGMRAEIMLNRVKICDWHSASQWQGLATVHKRFHRELKSLWHVASLCMVVELFEAAVLGMAFLNAGLQATSVSAMWGCFIWSAVLAKVRIFNRLTPLAKTNSMCDNLGPAADAYIDRNMNGETLLEYIKFTQYLNRTYTGIAMPLTGFITYEWLLSKGILMATVVPTLVAWTKNSFQKF